MTYDRPGDIIAARREELGLTQAEVAAQLGYDNPNFISMLEGGRSRVPPERAFDFCTALGLPRLWFLDRVLRDREGLTFLADWLFGEGGRLRAAYLADAAPPEEPTPPKGSEAREPGGGDAAGGRAPAAVPPAARPPAAEPTGRSPAPRPSSRPRPTPAPAAWTIEYEGVLRILPPWAAAASI